MVKNKSRFDGLDVAAMSTQIRGLLGHKLVNVYDGIALSTSISSDSSGKSTFLFKLANPSARSEAEKDPTKDNDDVVSNRNMLLIESGVRFHKTTFYTTSDNNSTPSPFAMKLRKHLRNLRLENVTQLGNLDRVVDFRFGSGEYAHHLILELYGVGNIILTNEKYLILALLRVHEYSSNSNDTDNGGDRDVVKVRVGNIYPVTYATTISTNTNSEESSSKNLLDMNAAEACEWTKAELFSIKEKLLLKSESNSGKNKSKKKKDQDGSVNLKMILLKPSSGFFHYGPSLIEHCVLSAGLNATKKFNLETMETVIPSDKWAVLLESLKTEGSRIIKNFEGAEGKGYVLYMNKPIKDKDAISELVKSMPHSDKLFEEFQPHLLKQHEDRPHMTYNNFSLAVDEFFSLMEGQKRAARAEAAENSALERLEKIKKDQSKRVKGLEIEMERVKEHAELVEMHADDVDKALGVINSALASGMDWDSLEELVEVEKANMNPIALLIKRLELDKDEIVLSLPDTMSWDQDSGDAPPIADVSISLKESAYGNARNMYDKYRISKEKASKTAEASEKALQAAEANAQKQIEQAQKKKKMSYSVMMQPQRKQHWFEKFLWFITSDNYICIGGRDAQQNEQLVKRYLRPGDAYLHADVHGAPTCILRAKRRRTTKGTTEVLPLSDQALREAGNFAICRSSAWGSRMVTSAWWVESHQVSKTAPTGEYLTVGSFMIRGKKNFLPPVSLEMGLGVVFRLGDDASVARHANERRDFALMAHDQKSAEMGDFDGKASAKNKKVFDDSVEETGSRLTKNTHEVSKDNDVDLADDGDSDLKADSVLKAVTKKMPTNIPRDSISAEGDEDKGDGDSSQLFSSGLEPASPKRDQQTWKKKGLSAKDRKLIKKYGSLEQAEKALAAIRLEEEELVKKKEQLNAEKAKNTMEQAQSSNGTNVRGKKSKLKKKAKKYADQDDEDRELAFLALQGGSKKKKKKGGRNTEAESMNQMKAAAETTDLLIRDAKEFVDKLPLKVSEILAKIVTTNDDNVRWDKFDAEVLEQLLSLELIDSQKAAANRLLQLTENTRIDNFSASLAGIIRTIQKYGYEGIQESEIGNNDKKQRTRKTKAEKESEKEAWREILAEDGIIEESSIGNDGSVDDTAEVSKLTGKPLPEDVVLYALPICAPYSTLAQYKYRVKLTPGNQKRGKASKQCLEMFYRTEDSNSGKKGGNSKNPINNARYIAMIKTVNDNEWVQAICGDVKISAAGASKVAKRSKAAKKKKK